MHEAAENRAVSSGVRGGRVTHQSLFNIKVTGLHFSTAARLTCPDNRNGKAKLFCSCFDEAVQRELGYKGSIFIRKSFNRF